MSTIEIYLYLYMLGFQRDFGISLPENSNSWLANGVRVLWWTGIAQGETTQCSVQLAPVWLRTYRLPRTRANKGNGVLSQT